VEIRICDMPTNLEDTLAVVAMVQALMAKLYLMFKRNTAWRTYSRSLIEENKWRAARYGVGAKLIDFAMQEERPYPTLAHELVGFVSEATDVFGTQKYMDRVLTIAHEGTSAQRQIEIFESTNDLKAVVDWLISETMMGIE